jgi:receptor protein-tyrosine kinase
MATKSAHLVERLAARLRADAGLGDSDLADPPPVWSPSERVATPVAVPATEPAPLSPVAPTDTGAVTTEEARATAAPPAAIRTIDLPTMQSAGLLCVGRRTKSFEEYRVTTERIMRTLRASRPNRAASGNLLMVTSARTGEGKSFSTLNLAASLVQNRFSEALLIDADEKPKSLSHLLGVHDLPGLMNLGQDVRVEAAMIPTAAEGMWVLPFGQTKPGERDLAITRTVATEIRSARRA